MGEDSLKSFFEDIAKDNSRVVNNLYDTLDSVSKDYYSTANQSDITKLTDKIYNSTGMSPVLFAEKVDNRIPEGGYLLEPVKSTPAFISKETIDWGGKGGFNINNVQLTPDSSGLGYNAKIVKVDPMTGLQVNQDIEETNWKYSKNVYSIDSSMETTILAEIKQHIESFYCFVKIKTLRDLELAFSKFHCHIAQTEAEAIGVRIEKLSDGTFLAIN